MRNIHRFLLGVTSVLLLAGLLVGCARPEQVPTLKVGYVGHDHQTALYVACMEWERMKKEYDLYLKPVREKEFYELYDHGERIANIELYLSGGGSKMPSLMSLGHFEMGFGGVAAVAFFVDKGSPMKIISPLHTKGDMLVVPPMNPANSWREFCDWVIEEEKQIKVGFKNPVAIALLILEGALQYEEISFTYDAAETEAEILLVNMKGERNLVPGLQSEIIDAYISNNPWCALAEYRGVGKSIADLNELPPGLWKDHPCCCVAATDQAIREKREIITRMLELTTIATNYMNEDLEIGIRCASKWIGTPIEVERASMPTSGYTVNPSPEWLTGVRLWCETMSGLGKLEGSLKGKTWEETEPLLLDLSLLKEGFADLVIRGVKKIY